MRGKSPVKIESRCLRFDHAGTIRTYRQYIPKVLPKKSLSLLLVLHGGGDSGSGIESISTGKFNRIADKSGVVVLYPDGVDRTWNDRRHDANTQQDSTPVDDVEFLRALVADVSSRYAIDSKRIYATGLSNGGLMTLRLACDAADVFSAVAAVAANFSVDLARECRPSRMISVAMINGTDDPMMPWLGGDIVLFGSRQGEVLSTQESFERWALIGDCAIPTTHMERDRIPEDGTKLVRHVARECKNGSEVRLFEILGGGHTWPNGHPYLGRRVIGKVSREFDASEEVWSFFASRRR
jgi:polyhydroxybutyrate depolymerase